MLEKSLWRVVILESPEFEEYVAFDRRNGQERVRWHRPVGWEASPDYIENYQSNKYFEPKTDRWFKSRSSVATRAKRLEELGYKVVLQKSAPVQWPDLPHERVPEKTELQKVREAIQVLMKAGLVDSYEQILGD